MPTAYAKLLLSVNGGANQTGGIQVSPGDVIHVSGENPGYWAHGQFELYEWPDGWTPPGGWTLQTTSEGSKYVFYSIGGTTPPDITVPTNAGTLWGKWLLRLIVNDGLRNGQEDLSLTDEATAFETFSPRLLRGFAAREQDQFDPQRAWAGDLDKNFKRLDTLIAGLGGGGGSTPTGTGFVHVTGGVQDPAATLVNLTADVSNVLPIANGGTGLSAVGAANTVLTSTGSALAFVSSLILAGLTLTGLAGGGTRMVTVDNSGVIHAQAIPSGAISVSGSGVVHVTGGTIDGAASIGAANTVLATNGAATDTAWTLIADANVSGSAAISGTKISPNFGSQLVQTTGTVRATALELTSGGPTVTEGSGVPSSTPPNGSIFLRTDGTAATTIYVRNSGTWSTILASTTYGTDIDPASVAGNQFVVGLTGGTSGTPGEVLVRNGASLAFVGATPHASVGYIRAPSAASVILVSVRKNDNSADLVQLASSSSDYAFFGGDSGLAHQFVGTFVQATTAVILVVGSTWVVEATTAKVTFAAPLELVASGPQILQGSGAPSSTPPNGSFYLRTDGTSSTTAYVRAAGAWTALGTGGGGTPGGSTTQIQYNNGGAFGGTAEFTYASSKLNVSSSGALTFGSTPASTGQERFSNGNGAFVKNNAGSGNHGVWLSATDALLYGATDAFGTSATTTTYLCGGGGVNLVVSGTSILAVTGTTTTFAGSAFAFGAGVITHGSSAAATGDYRAKNAWTLNLNNGGGTADLTALTINASNGLYLGGNASLGNQVAASTLQALTGGTVSLLVGSVAQAVVTDTTLSVQSGFNLIVGTLSPTMHSATNTLFLANGTQPSAAPTNGVYMSGDGGCFHFRSSFSSAGVPINIKFVEVRGGASATIDPDHAIQIIVDKPSLAGQTRYLAMYLPST